jgi:predicted ribonuclease YlaK
MVKNTKGGSSHKKLARKKENDNEVMHVNLNLNFKTENIIVLVEKNMGNCFSAKLLHYAGAVDTFKTEIKVLHQRGRRGKSNFDHAASRVALVSLINGIRLDNNCIGVVEEFLGKTMLNPTMYSNVHEEQNFIFNEARVVFSTLS